VFGTAAACLSACSAVTTRPDRVANANLAQLVRFGAWVQTLDNAELDEQYQELLTQYRASPSHDRAIKLSLVLSRPGAQAGALAEALALLAEVQHGQGEDAELGRLFYSSIRERHLAATALESLSASLTTERDRSAALDAELAAARAVVETARRESAALGQQLDALKAIEARMRRQ
jgi:hypothetical protein